MNRPNLLLLAAAVSICLLLTTSPPCHADFTDIGAVLPGVHYSSVAWGDYDGDGDLDLAMTGQTETSVVGKIFRNDGGTFVDTLAALRGSYGDDLKWGDYDGDGDIDLATTGAGGNHLYRNDNGVFTDTAAVLGGAYPNAADWGDYDNDGDLDLILGVQYVMYGAVTKIFRNDGGTLTQSAVELPQAWGSVVWGDYDNDGDLDLATAGSASKIYRNDGGVFTDIGAGLPGLGGASLAWGDYDNDGDLDLVIAGTTSYPVTHITRLYRNDAGTFVDSGVNLAGVSDGSLAWGDYDNDGDLDLALAGNASTPGSYDKYYVARIYRNDAAPDTPPTVPTGLSVTFTQAGLTMSWNAASDMETPAPGLSYNIRVGTTQGGCEVMSGMADAQTGLRRIAALGNAQKRLSWTLRNVPSAATYYCSVQAIDSAFAGSAWTEPCSVTGHKISGHIRTSVAVTGVAVVASNSGASTITDASGYYELYLPDGWSGTVVPNKSNYVFAPGSKDYSGLTSDQAGQDFSALTLVDSGISLAAGYGVPAWGDYDNDGDLDLAVAGAGSTRIYRNDQGVFVDSGASLVGLSSCSLAWGDYDNDGDLDLAVAGYSTGSPHYVSKIYRNNNGVFVDTGAAIIGVDYCSLAWGDYDNDGDLDLAIAGYTGTGSVSKIYRNDNGSFADIGAGLVGVDHCSLTWGDYDNDGDLDLAIAGSYISRIYRNNNGVFVDAGANLVGVDYCSIAWGDYDADGDLDLAIAGCTNGTDVSVIYRNDSGVFTDIRAAIAGACLCSLAWGDYDNDGDLDLVVAGDTMSGRASILYHNDSGIFTDSGIALVALNAASSSWGDYNGDGCLDLAIAGNTGQGWVTKIYRCDSGAPNAPPVPPSSVDATLTTAGLTISWSAATDSETRVAGLSYNVRVGTTPGGSDVFSGMAGASGLRRVPALGNAQKRLSWTLKTTALKPAYYCSVQAVDGAYAGSEWATEVVAHACKISGHVRRNAGESGVTLAANNGGTAAVTDGSGYYELFVPSGWSGTVTPTKTSCCLAPASRAYANLVSDQADQDYSVIALVDVGANLVGVQGAVCWGDYDNDGDLDLALAGSSGSTRYARIYRNTNGTFADAGASLVAVDSGSLAWGDYDGDGDLDLAIAGYTGSSCITRIYQNTNGSFTDIGAALTGVRRCSLAWGDYDNDGDLDLAVAGFTSSGSRASKVYRNDDGAFTDIGAGLVGVDTCCVAWGDYDNDGDLDLAIAGSTGSGSASRIYRNDDGCFSDIGAGLVGVQLCSLAWGDYDNDGDLDLALAGGSSSTVSKIYRNDAGSFVDIGANLFGVAATGLVWGDYDNDGDLDLAISGAYGPLKFFTTVYSNDGGTFVDTHAPLTGAGNLAWGDYDGDGDLDLAFAASGGSGAITTLYRCDSAVPNTRPTAPTGLTSSYTKGKLTFNWNAAGDGQTPAAGLSYNVRVGSMPGGNDIVAGMADTATGMRRLPAIGNAQKKLSWTINAPASLSKCYWSVQAVDSAFAGSPWAEESSLEWDGVPPSILSVAVSPAIVASGDSVQLIVDATDDASVDTVAADGVPLTKSGSSTWTGTVQASGLLGQHTVTVTATDAAANTATDSSASYRTAAIYGLGCGSAAQPVMDGVFGLYLFRLWGKITVIDSGSFWIDDGAARVKVIAPGYDGIVDGDFVTARGILNPLASPPTLTCPADKITRLR